MPTDFLTADFSVGKQQPTRCLFPGLFRDQSCSCHLLNIVTIPANAYFSQHTTILEKDYEGQDLGQARESRNDKIVLQAHVSDPVCDSAELISIVYVK